MQVANCYVGVKRDPEKFYLDDALMNVLVQDKDEFVLLFLDCGVRLKNFIRYRLCDLYDEVCIKVNSSVLYLRTCDTANQPTSNVIITTYYSFCFIITIVPIRPIKVIIILLIIIIDLFVTKVNTVNV